MKCLQNLAAQEQIYLLLKRQRLRDRYPYLEDGGHHRDRYWYLEDGGHNRDRYPYLADGGSTVTDIRT